MSNGSARRVQFGVFEADLSTGELRRSGIRVRLQSQPFRLLAVLVEHPGVVVSRETLQLELWGADTTVDFDHSLGIAVNKLREALGDSAENPRFVETLAKRGYRFIAPVKAIDAHPEYAARV
ncbi:MAG: winged helix-turn-helix domain-containing protein, partial [Terracidiphilus sp.]